MRFTGILAAAWGVLGIIAVLVFAVVRLAPIAVEAVAQGMTPLQWVLMAASVVFMAWSEGYRGFQQRFSPRVAARALYLSRNPLPVPVLLAPLFCTGYFHGERRTKIVAWAATVGIIVLVILVQALPQPWRGILDAGVVVGLSWGTLSLVHIAVRTFRDDVYYYSPEVPGVTVDIARMA